MRINDYIFELASRFDAADLTFAHGTDNALDEAVYLVYCELDIDFETPLDALDQPLSEADRTRLEALVTRRIEEQVPLAYLVGYAWFAGHRFYCDSRALIPRSPIAELIVNDFQPLLRGAPQAILDLCTGGGCIGIACALQFPRSRVCLSDLSDDCLALAGKNIDLHALQDRVTTHRGDLFSGLDQRFDLIVSNPPYVGAGEVASLAPEFRHEPALGLLSEEDGLAIPLQILREAAEHLNEDGILIMEVGYSAEALQRRLSDVPLLWLDFEEGGEGVLALGRKQLEQYRERFN